MSIPHSAWQCSLFRKDGGMPSQTNQTLEMGAQNEQILLSA